MRTHELPTRLPIIVYSFLLYCLPLLYPYLYSIPTSTLYLPLLYTYLYSIPTSIYIIIIDTVK
jgi:hypothetical protein